MIEETETGMQAFDSFSEFIELRLRQETEVEPAVDETPTDELTLRSVDEKIKQATDPILRRVQEQFALLASRAEMESAGNSESSGSRRNCESCSSMFFRPESTDVSSCLLFFLCLSTFALFVFSVPYSIR